jgi:hypothetical protein
LAEVLTRCLSKRREDRFPDAAALRSALTAIDTTTQGWTPSLPVGDFGPRPTPYVPEPEPPAPPPGDRDRTVAGLGSELAGLTVRLPDGPVLPDFGPTPGAPPPVAPEPMAVLPALQWRQDEELTRPRTPPPRPRGRLWLLALAAVLVGVAVGVAMTVLNGPEDQASAPPTTTREQTPTTPSTPAVTGGDPAFAPTLTGLDDGGDTITLTWTDPTAGNLQFVVVDVTDEYVALATVAAGATTYTVSDVDPTADRYCFRIIGIGLANPATDRGASEDRCTDR